MTWNDELRAAFAAAVMPAERRELDEYSEYFRKLAPGRRGPSHGSAGIYPVNVVEVSAHLCRVQLSAKRWALAAPNINPPETRQQYGGGQHWTIEVVTQPMRGRDIGDAIKKVHAFAALVSKIRQRAVDQQPVGMAARKLSEANHGS